MGCPALCNFIVGTQQLVQIQCHSDAATEFPQLLTCKCSRRYASCCRYSL
uniref:Uncharacterized protein n=1 Tax=Kalanchoe fedtschenkoi TaxID=63787 RepID=A0A7N0TRM1_KALFE